MTKNLCKTFLSLIVFLSVNSVIYANNKVDIVGSNDETFNIQHWNQLNNINNTNALNEIVDIIALNDDQHWDQSNKIHDDIVLNDEEFNMDLFNDLHILSDNREMYAFTFTIEANSEVGINEIVEMNDMQRNVSWSNVTIPLNTRWSFNSSSGNGQFRIAQGVVADFIVSMNDNVSRNIVIDFLQSNGSSTELYRGNTNYQNVRIQAVGGDIWGNFRVTNNSSVPITVTAFMFF